MNTTRAVLLGAMTTVLGLLAGCEGSGTETVEPGLGQQRQEICEVDAQCFDLQCPPGEYPRCLPSSDPQAYPSCHCVRDDPEGDECPPITCGTGQVYDAETCSCTTPPPTCVPQSCTGNRYFDPTFCQCLCADPQCAPGFGFDLSTCSCVCIPEGCMPPRVWSCGTSTCVCPAGSPDPSTCPWFSPYNPDTCSCG